MKKVLSILLSVSMLIAILPVTFASAAFSGEAMVLEAEVLENGQEATEINAGDTITVNIKYARGFANLDSLTVVLTYDTSCLTLVSDSAVKTSKLASGYINSTTAGRILYSCFTGGNPVKLETTDAVVTAQFTVNSALTAQNIKTTLGLSVTDCTCTNIIDNSGNAVYPELGGNEANETLSLPCTIDNKTIVINPKSSDATLKALKYGEESVELVDGLYEYAVELPYGSEIPAVTYEKNDAKATVTDSTTDGVTTIVVTAEDGTKLTYKLTITVAEKLYTFKVTALNGTIKATYLDKTDEAWDAEKIAQFTTGTVVTLKATADEGATFLYWKDNTLGRIVSYNEEYTITIGTNKDIIAVYVEEGTYMVEFVGSNNKVYASLAANLDITVPKDPYILGHTFKGWAIDGVLIAEYVAGYVIPAQTFKANTKIVAQQEVEEITYTVTIINAQETLSGEYKYNESITVTPSEEMKKTGKFKCWMRDGQVVSYDEEYRFYVGNYSTTVEAVFVGADEEVEAKPVIIMAQPTVVAGNKLSFMMERRVPENCSVVEAGILLKAGDVSQITLDNYDHKGTSANTARDGFYTVRKGNVKPYEWWSAVGYLIYTDENGETQTMYSSYVAGWIKELGNDGLEDGGDF